MSKMPLILLHGALGCKDQFDSLLPHLSRELETHSFNFYGHGGKVCLESFTIDLFVHDVVRYMEMNGIDKANFFGYSMGGYVALVLAHHYPEKVGQIITLGTKFDWNENSAAAIVKYLHPDIMQEKVPEYTRTLSERHDPMDWKSVVRKTADMMAHLGKHPVLNLSETKISNQVLILRGDQDRTVNEQESVNAADALMNGSFKEIQGIKHPIESIDAADLAATINDELSN